MANQNIDQLAPGTTPTGTENVPTRQAGVTVRLTSSAIAAAGPPKAHAASHLSGGTDALSLGSLGGTITTAQITAQAVTPSKVANVSTNNRLLGRATAGAGSYEEITIGTGLAISGTTLSSTTGGVGTTRQIATSGSLTGGGDLSADRTLTLVNDSISPGVNLVYSTNSAGTKGWNSPSSIASSFNQGTAWTGTGSGAGSRSTQARIEDVTHVNVMSFYLGEADHTNAINKAFAAAATASGPASPSGFGWVARTTAVYFPPGDYTYSGTGVSLSGNAGFVIIGHPRTVRVIITSSVYLVTATGAVPYVHASGLTIFGGKGFFHSSQTGTNVFGRMIFRDMTFDNFSECAIGNEASDYPYWTIQHCMFSPNASAGATSVAIGGYLDETEISNCTFINHRYGLKIGNHLSGEVHIHKCDFLTFTSNVRAADIWFVPNNTDGFNVNAGYGSSIAFCKFGNEFQVSTDNRIIIANEDTSNPALTRVNRDHSTTFSTSSSVWFGGLNFICNRISSVGGQSAAFMASYIMNFTRCFFDRSNDIDGGYTYFCQFMGTQTGFGADIFAWNLEFPQIVGGGVPWTSGITNDVRGDIVQGNNRVICGPTIPAAGNFIRGDVCWNRNAAVGSPRGWQCTVGGAPGTWVSMGNL